MRTDPARRFQNPVELLKAMPAITGAIDEGGTVTRQSFQKRPPADSRGRTRKSPEKPDTAAKVSLTQNKFISSHGNAGRCR
jgi:hypothetical protein